jgi:hypothetical protein
MGYSTAFLLLCCNPNFPGYFFCFSFSLGKLVLALPAWLAIGNHSGQAGFALKKWNGFWKYPAHFFF